MRKFLVSIVIVLLVFNSRVSAQLLKPVPIFSFTISGQRAFEQPIIRERKVLYLYTPIVHSPLQFPSKYTLKYSLPKGAIFCRMEDAIYSRLNFWVKFRMGTDERYSN